VSTAFSEVISYLPMLLDKFNSPFKPTQDDYMRELHHHVKNGLGSKLHERLSTKLETDIENSQREMTGNK